MADIGKRLKELRTTARLTQKEVALRLSRQVSPITHQAVSKWENGEALPNALQFLALCRLYGVTDVLGTFQPGNRAPAMNEQGRRKLREYEQLLLASGLYGPRQTAPTTAPHRALRLYELPASAGTGQLLDGDQFTLVEVDERVPHNADFGVRLAGDSMQPWFMDGQIVWVHAQAVLENGDVGIILYDGEAYCKRFEAIERGIRLISLNPQYPPIHVTMTEELRVFGRVVG